MKILTTDDLILLLSSHKNNTFSLDDLERVLDHYGDDWFIEGNKWVKTTENEKMAALRNRTHSVASTLKPCPFCGGAAKIVKVVECWGHGEYHDVRYVTCTKCGIKGPSVCDMEVMYEKTATWDSVEERWNRRVDV